MKIIAACLSFIICLTSQIVCADDFTQRNFGISFSNINRLNIRKALNDTTMLYAGFGISHSEQNSATTSSTLNFSGTSNRTIYTGAVGARKYINYDKLSNFINLEVGRIISKYDNTTNSSSAGSSTYEYQAQMNTANITYGIEYYISSDISIESAAGIGVNWSEQLYPDNSYYSDKSVVFPLVNIALTYYW